MSPGRAERGGAHSPVIDAWVTSSTCDGLDGQMSAAGHCYGGGGVFHTSVRTDEQYNPMIQMQIAHGLTHGVPSHAHAPAPSVPLFAQHRIQRSAHVYSSSAMQHNSSLGLAPGVPPYSYNGVPASTFLATPTFPPACVGSVMGFGQYLDVYHGGGMRADMGAVANVCAVASPGGGMISPGVNAGAACFWDERTSEVYQAMPTGQGAAPTKWPAGFSRQWP